MNAPQQVPLLEQPIVVDPVARKHFTAGVAIARQMREQRTPERVRAWAHCMKMMLRVR